MIIYRYIDGFINFFLCIFNFFSRVVSTINIRLNMLLTRNKKLKSLRRSDECFILGNGPSLKNVDLNKLKEKDTFAVNFFYRDRKDDFVSRYFVAIDEVFASDENRDYLKTVQEENKDLIMLLRYQCYYNFHDLFDMNRCFFLYAKQFQAGKDIRVSCDKNMTACINVALQCIQIALYMGYKKIYLLGCEFSSYAQLNTEYFYGVSSSRRYSMGDEARWAALVHYHHYALERYAKKHGVEIINLTPGSLIDAYKRESIENVLKDGREE